MTGKKTPGWGLLVTGWTMHGCSPFGLGKLGCANERAVCSVLAIDPILVNFSEPISTRKQILRGCGRHVPLQLGLNGQNIK